MHFHNRADHFLFPLVINDFPFVQFFPEWQVMRSVWIFPSFSKCNAEGFKCIPNGCFGGREFGRNLPHRTPFDDVFLMEDGLVKS